MKATGKVKWFAQSYGFITPDDKSPEVFVHQSAIKAKGFRSLKQGDPVRYDCVSTDKGFAAKNVEVIE